MAWKQIFKTFEFFLYALSIVLCVPLGISFYYEYINPTPPFETWGFLLTIIISQSLAFLIRFFCKNEARELFRREGIAAVTLIWILTPAIGALPFVFNHTLDHFEDAYFEMSSGFTTTGLTVLAPKVYNEKNGQEEKINVNLSPKIGPPIVYSFYGTVKPVIDPATQKVTAEGIEALGKGLLFWRSFTQWLGGIGIVVLFVAILPTLGVGAKVLFQSETAGPIKETVSPRIRETASWLLKIYFGLTIIEIVALMATNAQLPFFDALTLTFSNISTGGFTIRSSNMEAYANSATEWIVIIFMLIGSINFSLYYYLLRGRLYRLKDPELSTYLILIAILGTIAAWKLFEIMPISTAIRHGFFQIISVLSTSGFVIGNYDLWPYALQTILLIAMFIGGMSGSTAGGIKIIRHYLLSRVAIHKTEMVFRPDSVRCLHYGSERISSQTITAVLCFFFSYIFLSALGTLIYVLDGIDPETALGLVACNLSNVGCAFNMAGPIHSCAFLSPFGKYFSSFLMILGRLELFILLALFLPSFWKKA